MYKKVIFVIKSKNTHIMKNKVCSILDKSRLYLYNTKE